ncbi:hypothetical protein M422DRAFT_29008 [Sphaerobolus stellatus SS14]|uniref:Unplaced genomic scaffold SPHSTscaffold_29, whole genome shotgun sequence n=1 Tax=Sphaerobolus stellatus (strain SS14) TaxID=990650 RepID=A0A0C9VIC4_SPHS4|nr:hypothetical protein M422DRAFT_29008 [Sphaerobolus stellatus SS14]
MSHHLITEEETIAIPNFLHHGHWPALKHITLDFYGSLFDSTMPISDAPRRAADAMASFLRCHTKLESFLVDNESEYYQGCLSEGHPSLQALNFGFRLWDYICNFYLVIPN